MSKRCLNNLDITDFLENVWQRRHLFIQQALPDFISPIDADELAGLALEDDVESRIITGTDNGPWNLKHGPFPAEIYPELGEHNWTLLVQAVDHYLEEAAELKQYFRFIPDWRLDDVMISFAPEGGSVGPHYDQYDVFLIQASGQRRWKIGQHCDDSTPLADNPDLKILADFDQQAEYLCEAGDIVYIPPGCAHWGISESDDCMSISIGFRAPSHEELIAELCDEVASELGSSKRYQDSRLVNQQHPGEISADAIAHVRQIISDHLLNDQKIAETLGKLMTQHKYDESCSTDSTPNICDSLYKRLDARLAWHCNIEGDITVFVNGQNLTVDGQHEHDLQQLADQMEFYRENYSEQSWGLFLQLASLGLFEETAE